jgi:hypothetical protein
LGGTTALSKPHPNFCVKEVAAEETFQRQRPWGEVTAQQWPDVKRSTPCKATRGAVFSAGRTQKRNEVMVTLRFFSAA